MQKGISGRVSGGPLVFYDDEKDETVLRQFQENVGGCVAPTSVSRRLNLGDDGLKRVRERKLQRDVRKEDHEGQEKVHRRRLLSAAEQSLDMRNATLLFMF